MSQVIQINRRAFLQGAGALVALPFFKSFRASGPAVTSHPTRTCFLYVPHGMHMPEWTPETFGPLAKGKDQWPAILRPLADPDLLRYLVVASGLHNKASEKTGRLEGVGQHARSIAAYLSAVYPDRATRTAGPTIDVVLSKGLAGRARVPLLNLTTEYAEDQKDDSYGETYNYALSWKDAERIIQPVKSPRQVFQRLCGAAETSNDMEGSVRKRRESQKSVLDAVLEASRSLRADLGDADAKRLDEYLEHIRGVEQEIETSELAETPPACADGSAWSDEPELFDHRLRIMLDLLHLALSANLTRVATLMFGAERSERDFGFLSGRAGIDMYGGHHTISHHKGDKKQIQKYVQISVYHSQHLARFLRKLRETPEGDGNLLDHTLVLYGASMSDGNAHEHTGVPLLLAGKGNGLLNPGKDGAHVRYDDKPLANLYLTLLQKLSALDPAGNVYTSFGNSGGTLSLPG